MGRMRPASPYVCAILLLALSGCPGGSSAPDITIVHPTPGLSIASTAFEVDLSAQVVPTSVQLSVNGIAVPAQDVQIQTTATGAKLTGAMDRNALQPGRYNALTATGQTQSGQTVTATSNFVWFDVLPAGISPTSPLPGIGGVSSGTGTTGSGSTPSLGGLSGLLSGLGGLLPTTGQGPQLTVIRPTRGEFVPFAAPFEIEGIATDPNGITDLTIATDGTPPQTRIASLDPTSGRFLFDWQFDEPGLHRFLIQATNTRGARSYVKVSVYVGERRDSGASIDYASQLALTSQGFHSLGKLIEPILTPEVMYRDVPRNQMIWSNSVGVTKAKMWAIGLGHRSLLLDLSVEEGLLHIHAELEELYLSGKVETKTFFVKATAYPITTAQTALYDGWCTMTKGPGGEVLVEVQRQEVTINGLNTKVGGLPSAIIELVIDLSYTYLDEQIRTVLHDTVGVLIAKRLSEFFRVSGWREVTVLGETLQAGGEMAEVKLSGPNGRFWTIGRVVATNPDNPIQTPFPGWLHTPNDPTLPLPLENELTVAVSDDILNQMLYEGFRSGLLNLDIDKLENQAEFKTLTLGVLNSFLGTNIASLTGLTENIPVSIQVRPMLSPVLIMGYRGEDVIVQAHEMVIDIYAELETVHQLLFSVVADIDLPLEQLQVDIKGNSIKVQPKNLAVGVESGIIPYIDFRLEQMPLVTLPFEVFRPLIITIVQLAMPFLLEVLADPDFAELADLPLVDIKMWGKSDYLFLSGRLDATGRARDNGGPPHYGDSTEKEKAKMKFCALVALFGGTTWEPLLDVYRRFRDEYLGRNSGPTDAYYSYSYVLAALVAAEPALREPVTLLFVAGACALILLFQVQGAFLPVAIAVLALAALRLARPTVRLLRQTHAVGRRYCPLGLLTA